MHTSRATVFFFALNERGQRLLSQREKAAMPALHAVETMRYDPDRGVLTL